MTDPTQSELEAMKHAASMAGEYLEALGKTDLAHMTVDEWNMLIETVCGGYADKLVEIAERHMNIGRQIKAKIQVPDHDLPY